MVDMARIRKAKAQEMVMEKEIVISEDLKFVARLSEFNERMRIDVRKYIVTSKYTGFTKDGINLTADRLEELHNALGELLVTVKANGWDKQDEVE